MDSLLENAIQPRTHKQLDLLDWHYLAVQSCRPESRVVHNSFGDRDIHNFLNLSFCF